RPGRFPSWRPGSGTRHVIDQYTLAGPGRARRDRRDRARPRPDAHRRRWGSGETTALRMVAGRCDISAGAVTVGDRVVNHVSVDDNIAFGLRVEKLSKAE